VVPRDGAVWIWHLADEHFPEALESVDFCPGTPAILWELAALVFPTDERRPNSELRSGRTNSVRPDGIPCV
jgi:hypothetical protein